MSLIVQRPCSTARRTCWPNGFTLVELLVVIGIIALLIGILMPSLQKARQSANTVACMSDGRQLMQGMQLFVHEHKGYMCKAWFNNEPNDFSVRGEWGFRPPEWGWDFVLNTYLRSKEVFRCSEDESELTRPGNLPVSYRHNMSHFPNGPWHAMKITQLKDPTRAIIFAEGSTLRSTWHHVATWEPPLQAKVSQPYKDNIAWNRHSRGAARERTSLGKANYIFADGHVETLTWDETWQPIGGSTNIEGTDIPHTMWRQVYETKWGYWSDRQ